MRLQSLLEFPCQFTCERPRYITTLLSRQSGRQFQFPKSLTKREIKCLNAKIEELDFEGSIYDWTFLPDELIESGLPNFTGAVRGSVNSAIFPGSGAVQGHLKANWLS